jgi:hypothetical protein
LQARDRLPPALASYADLRLANLLVRQGKAAEARTLLQGVMRERPGLAVAVGLAKLAVAQSDPAAAVAALGFAPALKTVRAEDWAMFREIAGLLAAHGARPAALQVYANVARTKAPAPDALKALLTEARSIADAAGDLKQSLEFARQLSELEPAPTPPGGGLRRGATLELRSSRRSCRPGRRRWLPRRSGRSRGRNPWRPCRTTGPRPWRGSGSARCGASPFPSPGC